MLIEELDDFRKFVRIRPKIVAFQNGDVSPFATSPAIFQVLRESQILRAQQQRHPSRKLLIQLAKDVCGFVSRAVFPNDDFDRSRQTIDVLRQDAASRLLDELGVIVGQ